MYRAINILLFSATILFYSCDTTPMEGTIDESFHVNVEETVLPVRIRGNANSGVFVIFINGGPGLTSLDVAEIDLLGWKEQLEKEFAIVYYDQRGTGNAQGNIPNSTIRLSPYLHDLDKLIDVIDAKYEDAEIYLMGHSFGGFLGQSYLLSEYADELIKGWINVNGTTVLNPDIEWAYRREFLIDVANEKLAEGIDVDKWQGALDWTEENPEITTRDQKDKWIEYIGFPGGEVIPDEPLSLSLRGGLDLLFASSYNIFPAYLSDNLELVNDLLYEDVEGTNLLPLLSRIQVPSLLMWGKYDDLIPIQLGREAFEMYGTEDANKFFIEFEQSGHQPFINEPEAFQQAVIDFINR